jgi:hypothetical protein
VQVTRGRSANRVRISSCLAGSGWLPCSLNGPAPQKSPESQYGVSGIVAVMQARVM